VEQQERWAEAEADYAKATIDPGLSGARANWVEVRRVQGKPGSQP
jgi:hypothetical protein